MLGERNKACLAEAVELAKERIGLPILQEMGVGLLLDDRRIAVIEEVDPASAAELRANLKEAKIFVSGLLGLM